MSPGARGTTPPRRIRAAELVERYDAVLLDAFDVLVNADGGIAGAGELLARLEQAQKPFFVLTNDASRLPSSAAELYRSRGGLTIPESAIITSGSLLVPHFAQRGLQGAHCAVVGPPDSTRYVERAGGLPVPADGEFEVLVMGDESDVPFIETMDAVVTGCIRRIDAGEPLHLVLPNPDLVYPRGAQRYGVGIGSLASLVEGILRQRYPGRSDLVFDRLGKPYPAIFEEAVRLAGTRHLVLIGDQLPTDIRGARDFGIDSALVGTGVDRLRDEWHPDEVQPTWLLESLGG